MSKINGIFVKNSYFCPFFYQITKLLTKMRMKRFTLLTMLFALLGVTAFAQKGTDLRLLQGQIQSPNTLLKVMDASRLSQPSTKRAKRVASEDLVTPPATATVETWYTQDGKFYAAGQTSWVDCTSDMVSVKVAVDGDNLYIQGIAYWFKEGWIKGKIDGNKVQFEGAQLVGEDEYGPEYIAGSDDGSTLSDAIVFTYDAEKGILASVTNYILENSSDKEVAPYCYWYKPTFGKEAPAIPVPVEIPDNLDADEYVISYVNNQEMASSAYVYVGFDGNDVYIQGICSYVPEAWIKGTLEGTTITFPGGQYFGPYSKYEMFLQAEDVVFNYDAEANKLTATETITVVTADGLKGDIYNQAVISKVVEKAGTPATPVISEIYDSQDGPVAIFEVPVVDVDGNGMVSSKLSFQFFSDIEQEISPVTFDPSNYSKLKEAMTVIPYGFTEDWDFYTTYIYLNQPDFNNWNKIGIQSIYTGGGEENKSEVYWLTLKEYGKIGFDFNAMDLACSSSDSHDGDITEDRVFTQDGVTLTISPKAEGATTENRFWSTKSGPQLRVYSGTLTFQVPVGKVITKIVFDASKWNEGNSADSGEFDGTTWTGEANKVVVTIAGNTQINSIVVNSCDYVPTPVEAPEDLTTETYIFKATAIEAKYDPADEVEEPYSNQVEVGFYGDDVYFRGLASDCPELWVKATKNEEGKYVIPANQYMGVLELWGGLFTFDFFFTAIDENGNMIDAVLDYDAEKSLFTTDQTLVLNASLSDVDPYITFKNVTIEKFVEVAATPVDPIVESVHFVDTSYPCIYCNIPAEGTNGEALNLNKFFYTIWVEKDGQQQPYVFTAEAYSLDFQEDVVEVPYTHDGYDLYAYGEIIYFEDAQDELLTWTKVGIQSIYKGAGEEHKSNIVWLENESFDGISDINADTNDGKFIIFNLAGQRLDAPQKGLNIINGRKVLVK